MIQVPAEAAQLWHSVVVQIGAALALMMPGGALAWKVLRNGRRNGTSRDGLAAQVARLEVTVEGLSARHAEAARAITELRNEMRDDFKGLRESLGTVHRRIDEYLRAEGRR